MKGDPYPYQLHLFTLRVWREQIDQNAYEWRGEVKNTLTGEIRYFRNAASLYDSLLALLEPQFEDRRYEERRVDDGESRE